MPAALNAQIAARTAHAIREALDQLANGWTDTEVLKVAVDAWGVIQELKDQAEAEHELEAELLGLIMPLLWATACQHASPMHPALHCYRENGHQGGHLFTVKSYRTNLPQVVAS